MELRNAAALAPRSGGSRHAHGGSVRASIRHGADSGDDGGTVAGRGSDGAAVTRRGAARRVSATDRPTRHPAAAAARHGEAHWASKFRHPTTCMPKSLNHTGGVDG